MNKIAPEPVRYVMKTGLVESNTIGKTSLCQLHTQYEISNEHPLVDIIGDIPCSTSISNSSAFPMPEMVHESPTDSFSTIPIDPYHEDSTTPSAPVSEEERTPCGGKPFPDASGIGEEMCRICHGGKETGSTLMAPCLCAGSMRHVHRSCLQKWLRTSGTKQCELCRFHFHLKTTTKPFKDWRGIEMSYRERKKVVCSVSFHAIAVTCVVWSLIVLIERTAEEASRGSYEWPFWTKLIVIVVGFTGGVVFMYVQCRMYANLFLRWRAHNQAFLVQTVPDNILMSARRQVKKKAVHLHKQVTHMEEGLAVPAYP